MIDSECTSHTNNEMCLWNTMLPQSHVQGQKVLNNDTIWVGKQQEIDISTMIFEEIKLQMSEVWTDTQTKT